MILRKENFSFEQTTNNYFTGWKFKLSIAHDISKFLLNYTLWKARKLNNETAADLALYFIEVSSFCSQNAMKKLKLLKIVNLVSNFYHKSSKLKDFS